MKGTESRWSLLDGELLHQHRTAQAMINQLLDRLVDIFDFPVARTSYNGGMPPEIYSTPAEDIYVPMDETTIPCPDGKFHRSISDRIRGLLIRSNRSQTMTRTSVAICSNPTKCAEPRDPRISWLSRNKATSNAPASDLSIDRDDHEQQLDCGYQMLPEHAFI